MIDPLDVVVKARVLVKTPMGVRQFARESAELLRQLCDEVEALRKHVADLNHDLEATIKHSDEVYRRMMNDNA